MDIPDLVINVCPEDEVIVISPGCFIGKADHTT